MTNEIYTKIYKYLGFTYDPENNLRYGKKGIINLFLSTDKGKLHVSLGLDAKYPDSSSLRDYADYGTRDSIITSINLSASKPLDRIVKEIQKRLLDPNAALIDQAAKTLNERADRKANREKLIDKLIAETPGIKRAHQYDANKEEVELYISKFCTVRTWDGKTFTPCYYTSLNTAQLLAIINLASKKYLNNQGYTTPEEEKAAQTLITDASKAYDYFTDDELEEYTLEQYKENKKL